MKKAITGKPEVRFYASELQIEKRDDGQQSRVVSGYASVFNSWSVVLYGCFREKVDPKAFDGCSFDNCIASYQHDNSKLLGRFSSETLRLSVDEKGLRFELDVPETTLGNDLLVWISRGDITSMSFGFIVNEDKWLWSNEAEGRKYDERTILKISELYDISFVVYPAYEESLIDGVRSADEYAEYRSAMIANDQHQEELHQNDSDDLVKIESEIRARKIELLKIKTTKNL